MTQNSTDSNSSYRPLADRLRPSSFDQLVGQDHLVGPGQTLRRMVETNRVQSLVFWGPPGTGKTTLARLLAGVGGMYFVQLSAIFSGVAELKKIFAAAKQRKADGQATLLFVDEIHRFNRAQQDSFLPFVEDGTITLVGATTENPSFELNGALLSRLQVLILKPLGQDALALLLTRAEHYLGHSLPLKDDARSLLLSLADGDGRYLLNTVETILDLAEPSALIDAETLAQLVQRRAVVHDKNKEGHYNLISALHKSMRASDVDAALYWLARMFGGGEDPYFITRRLIRFASEDVGMADPQALTQAIAANDAYRILGSPEGELCIVQAVVYLATAPKSNAVYKAEKSSKQTARQLGSLPPPANILNAPTQLMKAIGYGQGYQYDHDNDDGFSGQNCFPEQMSRASFYRPVARGFERDIQKRLDYWKRLRAQKNPK